MALSLQDFLRFLENSPTSWHCVQEVSSRLSSQQFSPLEEHKHWALQSGGKYFVQRDGSIGAFCLPKTPPSKIVLLAAHTDSPALKVKQNPILSQNGMKLLEVATYGSPIVHSWLNRDLILTGRCFVQGQDGSVTQELFSLPNTPFLIPELAIHLDREVNQKGPQINKQEHLMPLFSLDTEKNFSDFLEGHFPEKKLLSFDLFLVPAEAPRLLGLQGEWLASYRIDNLTSVHAATSALLDYVDSSTLPLVFFWDHEEIGSTSWEGASSSFLADVLSRIQQFYQLSTEDLCVIKRNSLCFSLDMAHGVNPMHGNKYDPNHKPLLGHGIVIKQQADQKYASSSHSIALAMRYAQEASIEVQHFIPRSDIPCGSTVGPIIASQIGIRTVDLGCAQLSMHSARELVAVDDYQDLVTLLRTAINSSQNMIF